MDIPLRFVNQSNGPSTNVVVFQKNMASSSQTAIAWQFFANTTPGSIYPFVYPYTVTLAASDSFGNMLSPVSAETGQLFALVNTVAGDGLTYGGAASSAKNIEVLNGLTLGAMNAFVYRNGALLATKTGVAPGQKAVFQFKPTIFIGVVPPLTQGQRISSAIVQTVITQVSLLGIVSADIVMTGGGVGVSATPFTFNLANIVFSSDAPEA